MTALKFHTWGHDPHRAKVCEARRQHIYGPILPMEEPRRAWWKLWRNQ